MQRLPMLLQAKTYPGDSSQDDSPHLAVCSLGPRHGGPFKMAPGGLTHLLEAVDKFTKLIEAKPIKKLDGS
jgi:hypothetical protein